MYYRFFGQRNPEKDIERILVDLQGSGGVCYWTYVHEDNYYVGGASYTNAADSCISLGWANGASDSHFIFQLGYNHDSDTGFGCLQALEQNELIAAGGDEPTYCAQIGILNDMEGDVFNGFQFGESNTMINTGVSGQLDWCSMQIGYNHSSTNASTVYQFGESTGHYRPTNDGYNEARIILGNGNYENPGGAETHGFNQGSWFSRSTKITSWPATYTTVTVGTGFQFPIISDSIWYFVAYIAGTEIGCANSFAWKIEGVVENDGGTTSILTQTVTNVYRDVATREWQVAADDTNDRLVFQYRDATLGPDAVNTNIQMTMFTTEVGYD